MPAFVTIDSGRRRIALLAGSFVCLLAALALVAFAGLPSRADYSGFRLPGEHAFAPEIDALAPPFSGLTPDGATVNLLALRGAPVLINFWATWCAPCKAEMPAIEAVYARYRDQGLRVLAVNLGEPASAAAQWTSDLGLNVDVVLDPNGAIASLYRLRGQPSTYVVAPTGVITQIFYGPTTEAALESALQPFLSGT